MGEWFKIAIAAATVALASNTSWAKSQFSSPNGALRVDFEITSGQPFYSATFAGRKVVGRSKLGLNFAGAVPLTALRIQNISYAKTDSTYKLPVGKARSIRDNFQEYSVRLVESGSLHRRMTIHFKLYDDGFGFRYELPKQKSITDFQLAGEQTEFAFGPDASLLGVPLPFDSSFEGYYSGAKIQDLPKSPNFTLPVTVSQPGGLWIGVTEAALSDYAGLYLTPTAADRLGAELAPSIDNPAIAVRGTAPFSSPWRVVMISNRPGGLLESNIVNNLNEPTAIADTSWIHPGKIVFPWWNGYVLPTDPNDHDPSHKPGVNTWALERYIDFCAQNGIPYYSFDGFDQAWYGGDIGDPPPDADVTKPIPQLDMPAILRYGRQRGVKARLWMHAKALMSSGDVDHVFSVYESWGIEGVMIDFLNRDDQQMVQWYTKVIKAAARHHLTIGFHGVWKPTGLTRTYPNLLSQEGVMSSEYNRFNPAGCPPEHEMNYAFVRQLAGPLDVHPGSFRPIAPEDWNMNDYWDRAMGTLARELANYVVMESGMQMLVDYPAAYLARPREFEFVREVPVAWDETRVLSGEPGKYIVMARRSGSDWYIGAMTDRSARSVEIPLNFLDGRKYQAEMYYDPVNPRLHPVETIYQRESVSAERTLKLELGPSGGAAIRLKRL